MLSSGDAREVSTSRFSSQNAPLTVNSTTLDPVTAYRLTELQPDVDVVQTEAEAFAVGGFASGKGFEVESRYMLVRF